VLLVAAAFSTAARGQPAPRLATETRLAASEGRTVDDAGARFRVNGELSVYTDSDAVTVVTPAAGATVADPAGEWSASGTYLADIVSAASVDIVSTASGRWQEVRHAGALGATYAPGGFDATASTSASYEPDYLSLSGGAAVGVELAAKTVNPRVSYAYAHDTAGLTGTPFSVFSHELSRHSAAATVEFVLSGSTSLVAGIDGIFESGNAAKPYRFVPLFAPDIAARIPRGASVDLVNQYRLPGRASEQVPETRRRGSLSARLSQRFSGSTLLVSQRLYADDWGLEASTTDVRFVVDVGQRLYPWFHVRGHIQTAVGFWQRAYTATDAGAGAGGFPRFRTGDRELGPLQAGSLGAGIRWNVGPPERAETIGLVAQGDAVLTAYRDALFIVNRQALLGVLQVEVEF
jgi:hypothetical protein